MLYSLLLLFYIPHEEEKREEQENPTITNDGASVALASKPLRYAPPPQSSQRRPGWVRSRCVQRRSERFSGAIKRHTVKIRYKLLPSPVTSWHRQSHQLRQQRLPRRHIQTGGASAGYAHMADDEIIAGRVAAPSPRRRPTSRIQGRHIQTGGASTGYAHTASDKIVAGRAAE